MTVDQLNYVQATVVNLQHVHYFKMRNVLLVSTCYIKQHIVVLVGSSNSSTAVVWWGVKVVVVVVAVEMVVVIVEKLVGKWR